MWVGENEEEDARKCGRMEEAVREAKKWSGQRRDKDHTKSRP